MSAVGGSITGMSINGRPFSVTADADAGRDLGGSVNEVESNGDGTGRIIKVVGPWMVNDITVAIDDGNGDQEFLQDVANANDFVPIELTFASGETYGGSGTVVGNIVANNQSASAGIGLKGPKDLVKQ